MLKKEFLKNKILVCAVLGYLFLNLYLIIFLNQNNLFLILNGDANGWMQEAQKIHHGINIDQDIWWPPFYPIVASIFFNLSLPLIFLALFQFVVFCLSLYLMNKFLDMFKVYQKMKLIFLSVYALLPSHLLITKLPLAESLFLFFYVFHLFLFSKFIILNSSKYLFGSLPFLILATFTKPTTLYLHFFEVLIILLLFFYHQISKQKLTSLCVSLLLIPTFCYSSWAYKNYSHTGIFIFANVQNYNLLAHNFYHIYNFVTFFKLDKSLPYKGDIGSELTVENGENIRSYLINDLSQTFIKNSSGGNKLEQNKVVFSQGELGKSLLIKYFYIYIPVHFVESLYLFVPNNFELLKPILGIKYKYLLLSSGFVIGFISFSLFISSIFNFLMSFRRRFRRYSDKNLVKILFLLNIFYLMTAIGPVAFDDGGRFSFVFYSLILVFVAANFPKITFSLPGIQHLH
jgi:hypothetical protein